MQISQLAALFDITQTKHLVASWKQGGNLHSRIMRPGIPVREFGRLQLEKAIESLKIEIDRQGEICTNE